MLTAINAGPPQGPLSRNSSKPDKVEESKGSFDKVLAQKAAPKEETKASKQEDAKATSNKEEAPDRKVSKKDEKKEDGIENKKDPLQKKATVLRQKAIEGFMDSFESEFNVPPTRFVEAMAKLPVDDLDKNPEETADAVIAQLDLSEDQEKQAKEMYMSLVSDLSRIDKAAQPPTVVMADANAMMGSQLKERFMIQQEKKTMLNQSLGKMNDQFFMKPDEVAATPENLETGLKAQPTNRPEGLEAAIGLENGMGEDLSAMKDPSQGFQDVPVKEAPKAPTLPDSGMSSASVKEKKEVSGSNLLEQLKKLSEQPPQDVQGKPLPDALKPQALKSEASSQAPIQGAVAGIAAKQGQAQQQQQQQGEGFSKNSGKESGQQSHKENGQQISKESGKESSVKASGKPAESDSLNILGLAKDAAPGTPTAAPLETSQPFRSSPAAAGAIGMGRAVTSKDEPKDVNIRQIMNQAQYLIKKGGGEVKVEMSPEGLGQVHLKMAIHDGKVNLQMATETPEAKQAIESSMSELKSSLAAHKLSVDHVKVDVVGASSAGQGADNSSQNFQQQAQRDTRQFWNQFQESFGNRSQREGYSDAPGLKGYGTQRRDPLSAVDGTTTEKNRDVEGKGSGLNLVA